MSTYLTITVGIDDAGPDICFENEDAKLLLEAAVIGLEEVPEDVVPGEWSERLWYTIQTLQRRIREAQ